MGVNTGSMVKIVTEFVPKPAMVVMCDHPHCSVFTSQEITQLPQDWSEYMKAFVAGRQMEGWMIGLDRQICPGHVQQAHKQAPMVVVPKVTLN